MKQIREFKFFITPLIVFLFLSIAQVAFSDDHGREAVVSNVSKEKDFIRLFAGSKSGKDLQRNVGAFISGCCQSKDAAIALMDSNAFKMNVVTDPDTVERLNRDYDQSKKHWIESEDNYKFEENYTEFVFAERRPGLSRFWDLSAKYQVTLFIKDGRVAWITARVDRTIL